MLCCLVSTFALCCFLCARGLLHRICGPQLILPREAQGLRPVSVLFRNATREFPPKNEIPQKCGFWGFMLICRRAHFCTMGFAAQAALSDSRVIPGEARQTYGCVFSESSLFQVGYGTTKDNHQAWADFDTYLCPVCLAVTG